MCVHAHHSKNQIDVLVTNWLLLYSAWLSLANSKNTKKRICKEFNHYGCSYLMLAQEANPNRLILATWSQPFIPRFSPISSIYKSRACMGRQLLWSWRVNNILTLLNYNKMHNPFYRKKFNSERIWLNTHLWVAPTQHNTRNEASLAVSAQVTGNEQLLCNKKQGKRLSQSNAEYSPKCLEH